MIFKNTIFFFKKNILYLKIYNEFSTKQKSWWDLFLHQIIPPVVIWFNH